MANAIFDHLVYGVPDLQTGIEEFSDLTGVRPAPGGRHIGYGTANYLVGLGAGRYLEFIGVDPDATESPPRRMFGIDPTDQPRMLTWAVRTQDIDAAVAAARLRGYEPGAPARMSRRTANGDLLQWQLTPDSLEAAAGLVPFLIDWGSTRHPTSRDLPAVELISLTLATPEPGQLEHALSALGVTAQVERADVAELRAVISTMRGAITLS